MSTNQSKLFYINSGLPQQHNVVMTSRQLNSQQGASHSHMEMKLDRFLLINEFNSKSVSSSVETASVILRLIRTRAVFDLPGRFGDLTPTERPPHCVDENFGVGLVLTPSKTKL